MYRKPFLIGLAYLMTLFVITPIAHAQAKITGPWLWMIAPTEPGRGGAHSTDIDSLAVASGGTVTEADIAANGANEGDTVGNYAWTFGEISPNTGDINAVINQIGMAAGGLDNHTSYALIALESASPQRGVTMRVGSDDSIKVWLNGEVVHRKAVDRGSAGFQDEFQVDLLAGDNLLMVKVSELWGDWSMFVGIDSDGTAGGDQGTVPTDDRAHGDIGQQTVDIPDPNLRAIIETSLGKVSGASIAVDEMATLIRLEANEAGISNLTGLEGATNLIDLYLGANLASDLSPLAGLTNLTTLWLYDNNISDLSPLAGLTNLIGLHLSGNNISDLSPLVANAGLGGGDTINVKDNYLLSINHTSIKTHIPTLQSRGVTVEFDDRTHLNVGEPRTVRMIYFLPNDRPYRPDIVQKMKDEIPVIQTFYAEQMGAHGYGNKTFRIETDSQGEPMVHRVDGQYPDRHYEGHNRLNNSGVIDEIKQMFDLTVNIYFIIIDNSAGHLRGGGSRQGKNGGFALLTSSYFWAMAHELGHGFGLHHDFRDDAYIMSYGWGAQGTSGKLSPCHAEYLSVHPYFNARQQSQNVFGTTIQMLPPSLASPPNAIRLRFEVTDHDGLHQAQLLTPDLIWYGEGFPAVIGCERLTGTNSTVEFVTTELIPRSRSVRLLVVDVHGNISWSEMFPIDITSLLPPSEVVSIPDANLAAAVQHQIGGSITTHTMLNLRELDIPNHRITDLTGLEHAHTLRTLNLEGNSLSDISALGGLTQLTGLNLGNNSVSDISPLVVNTGLGSGDTVDTRGNPLSYLSIHTHIPALQSRGATVEFDNRAHPALLKISGDRQKGTSFTPLSNPYVVEVQDERGSAFKGVAVTFTITAGGGIIHREITTTDENGRAQSTLTLGPNLGTNTVSVSAAGIAGSITFHAVSDNLPTEYLLSVPAGVSWIHVPLKVTTVDGVAKTIKSIADLYDVLGGADTVNLLTTYHPTMQRWHSYLGASSRGTIVDKALTDDTGIIAFMNHAVSLRLRGDARGTNGNSSITLYPGLNLVGVPVRDARILRVSDLFTLEGIGQNISKITVLDNRRVKVVNRTSIANTQRGTAGDTPIDGGQSFILTARETTTVTISGGAWYNTSEMATVLPPPIPGIEVEDATPILVLKGSIVGEGTHVNREGFHVIVKNLSTGRAFPTVIGNENLSPLDKVALNLPINRDSRNGTNLIRGVGYQVTVVDVKAGRLAMIGDILEISAQFPDVSIRVQPVRYTVTAEDVLRGRIELGSLVTYQVLWETELLQNYPNPFRLETWIPYRLAEDAFVTLTIYDLSGHRVRTLNVGHRIAAVYESESEAIYWDGRNGLGERVASGVYFYHLSAEDYSATRRMVVVK